MSRAEATSSSFFSFDGEDAASLLPTRVAVVNEDADFSENMAMEIGQSSFGGGVNNASWTTSTAMPDSSAGESTAQCRGSNWPVLLLFFIVILAIGGNILVCVAVQRERKLRSMFSYFLVSLALSDMLSAILVMPLSIVRAFVDCLPLPKLVCFAWYSLDVFFTSSTICHLCMISIDRYLALSFPLRYCHTKSTRFTASKIAIVWIVSFCIAGPLFVLSMLDGQQQTVQHYKGCGPETQTFVISATVASFYVPLAIMTVMYALTVRALRRQLLEQRRMMVDNGQNHKHSVVTAAAKSRLVSDHAAMNAVADTGRSPPMLTSSSTVTVVSQTDVTLTSPSPGNSGSNVGSKSVLAVGVSDVPVHRQPNIGETSLSALSIVSSQSTAVAPAADVVQPSPADRRTPLDDPSSTADGLLRTQRGRRIKNGSAVEQLLTSSVGFTPNRRRPAFSTTATILLIPSSTTSTLSGPDRGRRAVRVLGILFAIFVVLYLPFFVVYIINRTCEACRPYITTSVVTAFEWLQYSGSMLNPIVYHVFNPDFRRAFHKILRCRQT